LEEQQAITRLKQGDLGGMEPLVKIYQARAVYAAYLIVRDMKLAEDIVQSAFLHATQTIHQFDAQRAFGPWFLRSVVNAAIKAAWQEQRFVALETDADDSLNPIILWMLDPRPVPTRSSKRTKLAGWYGRRWKQLPPEQRATIVMRHFLEMKESEMTEQLGRPLTTVRWWLRRLAKS
jgi:RNA polymerase sigma-70 factor (ECF subfamily)